MGLFEECNNFHIEIDNTKLTTSKKRRIRRKKLHASIYCQANNSNENNIEENFYKNIQSTEIAVENSLTESNLILNHNTTLKEILTRNILTSCQNSEINNIPSKIMSSKDDSEKSREDVKAAREAKKLAKQKAKKKDGDIKIHNVDVGENINPIPDSKDSNNSKTILAKNPVETKVQDMNVETKVVTENKKNIINSVSTSKDEVDKAVIKKSPDVPKEAIKAERAAKKASKHAKKKGEENTTVPATADLSVTDMVNTLKDIIIVAKEVQAVTARVEAIDLGSKKSEESSKSKAELKAERRAKQEAQRAAKQTAQQQKPPPKADTSKEVDKQKEEKIASQKVVEKPKSKTPVVQKMNWFHHLHTDHNIEETLNEISINSNLHPAIVKLGVQLGTRVISGANAKCIALLDALKKVVRDYSLPARTEAGRGLEASLSRAAAFLWRLRAPAAAQLNALAALRRHLTALPADAREFDAKKKLLEEIDRYIREQIDMAGEAISIAVRNKISNGDNILTYGCSSLIERIFCEAHDAGIHFRAVIVGTRLQKGARELLRRLVAKGVVCSYVDITALSYIMKDVSKVVVGAESLLANGSVVGAAGSLSVALEARANNVPMLVACETHKFSDRARADAFLADDMGDPDDLIDKNDENSPLKDWRSNPNLTLLNLTYDITPPALVTAVVTELAILPCTSAPAVLRYKLSEYGI